MIYRFLALIFLMLPGVVHAQAPFITTWKTDNSGVTNSTSISIPVHGSYTYNYDVDWENDGVYDEFNVTGSVTHNYGVAGTYTVAIKGNFPYIFHDEDLATDAEKLVEINQWGDISWRSMYQAFSGCQNMTIAATDAPDLSLVTTLGFMFDGCESMNTNINHWDVSTITHFNFTFRSCISFNQPLNNWDVSKAETFNHMFDGCDKFNQPLNNWKTGNVENFGAMFAWCDSFDQDISMWDTGSATSFAQMFSKALVFNQDISGWNVSNASNFSYMFASTTLFNQDISGWDMSGATNTAGMFWNNQAMTYSLNAWDVSNVTNMKEMFAGSIYDSNISGWNTGKVTNMSQMFSSNTGFDQNISSWNVSSVTNMSSMFKNATSFNQDITGWNTSAVTDMSYMFQKASSFDQDIGSWNVSKVINFAGMFNGADFNRDISLWNTGSATNMSGMFFENKAFDQDISGWNTGLVTDMSGMFQRASVFNQDIGLWNTASLQNASEMFSGAVSFNHDLGDWDISNITTLDGALYDAGLSSFNYDMTLIGWAESSSKKSGVPLGANNLTYCSGASSRQELIDDHGWVITGDSEDCSTPEAFITTWKTDNAGVSNSTSIYIKLGSGSFNYNVDWDNDGVYDEYGLTGEVTHDFGVAGTYTIRISGDFPYIRFEHGGDKEKLLDIVQWGEIEWENMLEAFDGCLNMTISATDAPDLSQVTQMQGMFLNCRSMNTNLNHWDVSNITNMGGAFHNCTSFNQPLSNWDVSNVEKFQNMFLYATTFDQDLSSWDTGSATNMSSMFRGAADFDGDITTWDVMDVTNMSNMFQSAVSFNQNISSWDVANVTNMNYMFDDAESFDQNISSWNVGKVETMRGIFASTDKFNQPLNAWNVGSVTDMREMFFNALVFNQPLNSWNVSNVIYMNNMFRNADAFNQPLNNWDVSNVEDMTGMFRETPVFNDNITVWDVSNVTNMSLMFSYTSVFNQNITSWNVGKVANTSEMFRSAVAFDQDISGWTMASDTTMNGMFRDATSFNQNLGSWDVEQVNDMTNMFYGITLSTDNYDAILIGWNDQDLQNGVTFHGGNSKYCAGASARVNMISSDGWSISDGGTSDAAIPVIVCQDITITLDSDGNATITADMLDGGTTDDCTSGTDLVFTASQTSFDCTDIGNVTVTLTVTDFEGNSDTCDATVTVEAPAVSVTSCPSDISVVASGCSAIATWTTPTVSCGSTLTSTHNSGDTFGLGVTTVTYTATHPDGSTATCSFDVNVTGGVSVSLITSSNESCYGESDGQAFINVIGGTSPYTYDWDYDGTGDFDDFKNQGGLPSGDNVVIVRDGSGCEQSLTVNIGYDPLEIYNCPSDITVLTNSSGCEAIIVWSAAKIFCSGATLTSSHNIGDAFGIGTTTVTYTATNAVDTVTCSFDVTVYNDLSATEDGVTNASCFDSADGTALLTITGGNAPYTYDWDHDGTGDYDDAEDPTDLPIGTTNYVVRDATGCQLSGSVDIISDPLEIDNCPSDVTILTNTNGCQAIVNWSMPIVNCTGASFVSTHNSGDIFGLGTTTVIYTATNTIGEVVSCSFDVTVYNDLAVSEDGTTNASCFNSADGAAMLAVTGGVAPYTYDWDTDGTGDFDDIEDPTNLPRGANDYVARDATGCEVTGSVTINSDPLEILGCPTDIVAITNAAGCQASVTWTEPTVVCSGATITSTHNPGDIFGIGTTTVTYTSSNSIGEEVICSFDVTVFNDLTASIDGTTNASCFDSADGAAMLAVSGGVAPYTYDWDTDGTGDFDDIQDPTNLPRGTNDYVVRDATGCEVTGSIAIDSEPLLIDNCPSDITILADMTGCRATATWIPPTVNCPGAILTSTHNPGDIFDVGTTTVTYAASNAIGETTTCSFNVTVVSDLSINVDSNRDPLCHDSLNGYIDISVSGGNTPYTYQWSDEVTSDLSDSEDLAGVGQGVYSLGVTDGLGCIAKTNIQLEQPDSLRMEIQIVASEDSGNRVIDLTVTGGSVPYSFTWSHNNITNYSTEEDIELLETGTYSVNVTDMNGCTNTISIDINAEKLACDALDFKIYPNPSDGIFNLTFQSCVDEAYIEIFDMIGKKIAELNTSTVNNQLLLTQVADGQYVLRITMNGRSLSKLISVMK